MGDESRSGDSPYTGESPANSGPSRTAPARELLLANHQFPGPYTIKAFGPADAVFRAAVADAATSVVEERFESSERTTRGGRSVCVTLELRAESVDEVISIYGRLHAVERLKLIL